MKHAFTLYTVIRHHHLRNYAEDGYVTIHIRNIEKLATEKNFSPPIVSDLFNVYNYPYNFRHQSYFSIPNVNSVCHGLEGLSNLGPKIWNLVPRVLKELDDINFFKTEIKNRNPDDCLCRLLKLYLANVGFV